MRYHSSSDEGDYSTPSATNRRGRRLLRGDRRRRCREDGVIDVDSSNDDDTNDNHPVDLNPLGDSQSSTNDPAQKNSEMLCSSQTSSSPRGERGHMDIQSQGQSETETQQNMLVEDPDSDTMRIMISTDNHLGFAENDNVRGNDSFAALEEVLYLAKEYSCDMVLLAGDLFHENRPSRRTLYKTSKKWLLLLTVVVVVSTVKESCCNIARGC